MTLTRLGLTGPLANLSFAVIPPPDPTDPPLTFAEWLAAVSTSRCVLAELQPAEALTGWVAVGGATPNVYSVAWPSIIAADVAPGGIARRLDAVRENATAYTLQASVAAVNSTAGSYYLTGGTLYVHTTTGSAPSTFAALIAFFSIFVATAPLDFVDGALYEPRLTGRFPAIAVEAEDDFNAVKSFASGALDLVNAGGLFDTLSTTYIWRNKAVNLYLGGGSVVRADYEPVASLRIDSLTVTDEVARLSVRSSASVLEQQVPFDTITRDEYPDAAEGVAGRYKPILYGRKEHIPPLLVDSYLRRNPDFVGTPADFADVYLIADPAVQVVSDVLAVRAVSLASGLTVGVGADSYTVDSSGCTVTVTDAAWRSDQWSIRVDAIGETDGVGGYLSTVGEISEHLLLALGVPSADIDAASFAAADVAAPFELALWLHEPSEAASVVVLLQQSVMGGLIVGRDGRWQWRVFDLGDDSTIGTLADEDFVSWEPVERIDQIYPLVRLYYDIGPATDGDLLAGYQLVTAENAATRYLYETSAGVSIRTALRSRSDATLMAQRYRLFSTLPDVQVHADLRGLDLMTAEMFDQVRVTRRRAATLTGAYASTRMEIVGIEKRLDPVGVRLRLSDLGGLSALYGGVRAWANDDAPSSWAASSGTEQGELMYWGDASDEVDTGVTNPAIWW